MSDASSKKSDASDGVYFEDPHLPSGWTRKCVQRSTGQSAGKWDVYIYNPMGKKFRSQTEVRAYLNQIGSDISPSLFCFNAHSQAGIPGARRRTSTPVPDKPKTQPKTQPKSESKSQPKSQPKPKTELKSKEKYIPKAKPAATKLASKAVRRAKTAKPPKPGVASNANPKLKVKMFDMAKKRAATRAAAAEPPAKSPRVASKGTRTPGERRTPKPVRTPAPLRPLASAHKNTAQAGRQQWAPPESPYDIVQERYYADPWKLLVSTIVLSKSSEECASDVRGDPPPVLESRMARPVLEKFFERWPSAAEAEKADPAAINELMAPLQLSEDIAKFIMQFSEEYAAKKWKSPADLPGIGRLGQDSHRLFCLGQWKQVQPKDHMLCLYHNWIWTNYKALQLE